MCILIRKAVAIRKERTCATGLIPAFPTPSAFSMQEAFTEHLLRARHCSGSWGSQGTKATGTLSSHLSRETPQTNRRLNRQRIDDGQDYGIQAIREEA